MNYQHFGAMYVHFEYIFVYLLHLIVNKTQDIDFSSYLKEYKFFTTITFLGWPYIPYMIIMIFFSWKIFIFIKIWMKTLFFKRHLHANRRGREEGSANSYCPQSCIRAGVHNRIWPSSTTWENLSEFSYCQLHTDKTKTH